MKDSSEIDQAKNDHKPKEEEEEEKKEEAESTAELMKCKKTDGKRWRCKRTAKLPHSLCSYHLAQLRSYRARFDDQASVDRHKKSHSPADCGGAASNYYYYSILGPWWGKRRGPINVNEGGGNGDCNDILENESFAGDGDGENCHEGVGVVEEEEDGGGSCREETYVKKKKRVIKKRGRKPVKSRSLKSLL